MGARARVLESDSGSRAPGGWTYPYEFSPAEPHPVTTSGGAWRTSPAGNWIYPEHALGPVMAELEPWGHDAPTRERNTILWTNLQGEGGNRRV